MRTETLTLGDKGWEEGFEFGFAKDGEGSIVFLHSERYRPPVVDDGEIIAGSPMPVLSMPAGTAIAAVVVPGRKGLTASYWCSLAELQNARAELARREEVAAAKRAAEEDKRQANQRATMDYLWTETLRINRKLDREAARQAAVLAITVPDPNLSARPTHARRKVEFVGCC